MVAGGDDRREFEAEILAWLEGQPSLGDLEVLIDELSTAEAALVADIDRRMLLEPAEEELPSLSPDLVERVVAAVQARIVPRSSTTAADDVTAVKFERGFRLLELLSELESSEGVVQARETVATGLAQLVQQDLAGGGRGTRAD